MIDDMAIQRTRLAKASAIASILKGAGALGCDVPLIDSRGRRAAEALAGVRRGSDDTWALVGDVLSTSALLCAPTIHALFQSGD